MYSITGFTREQIEFIADEIADSYPAKHHICGRREILSLTEKVEITLTYLRRNRTQREISDEYGVSQPLISEVIAECTRRIVTVFGSEIPDLNDLRKRAKRDAMLVDGTFLPRSRHVYDPELHSGKHHSNGYNVQIVSTLDGELVYVSEPLPGKIHDAKAIRETKILDHLDPENTLADKGYAGLGLITPVKRKHGEEYEERDRVFNKSVNSPRSAVERCIAHFKRWKIIATGYRRPLKTLPQTLRTIIALEFLKKSL